MRDMRTRLPLVLAVALLFATGATAQETWHWEGDVARGDQLQIKGVNGNVTATPAAGNRVLVDATKEAKRGDPTEVTIEVVEHPGGVTICAVYPTPPGREPNECRPGDEGRMNVQKNDTFVNFRVQVPAGVELRFGTVNGNVTARDLQGDVHASTVNGNVEVSTSGSAMAHTVNGSIEASMGRVGGGDLSFHTVNGGIEVGLPEGAGARVRAETVNGDFDTDFPLTIQGNVATRHWGPKKIQGTIGDGGPEIELRTVNGSIRLRRM